MTVSLTLVEVSVSMSQIAFPNSEVTTAKSPVVSDAVLRSSLAREHVGKVFIKIKGEVEGVVVHLLANGKRELKDAALRLSHRDGVLGKRLCARIVVEATYTLGGPQT